MIQQRQPRATFWRVTTLFIAPLLLGPAPAWSAAGAGERCGGFAVVPCDAGLWCDPEPGCFTDPWGTCVAVPEMCTQQFEPVCGCDGTTYSNDCKRQAGKVARQADGACPASFPKGSCDAAAMSIDRSACSAP